MSNNNSGDEGSLSSGNTGEIEVHEDQEKEQQFSENQNQNQNYLHTSTPPSAAVSNPHPTKKKRNLPGTPDPNAEIVALSPTTLMATNRFVCEICNKGFQRDQNLQLHRRGHNLPWKLRQRASTDQVKKRVYVCPESSCVHHNPARALGDLTGIKKHYSRKHGEKKWKCDKCSKRYAVQSDWKAHQKTCGTREYKCDCGTIFSRRDSFITHRAFCDALTEENNRVNQAHSSTTIPPNLPDLMSDFPNIQSPLTSLSQDLGPSPFKPTSMGGSLFAGPKPISASGGPIIPGSAHMSATALLQKAAQMGATASNSNSNSSIYSPMMQKSFVTGMAALDHVHVSSPIHNNSNNDKPPFSDAIAIAMNPFIHPRSHDQSNMVQNMFPKSPPEIMSHLFDTSNINNAIATTSAGGCMMNDHMGMLMSQMLMGSDDQIQNPGMMMTTMKNNNSVEQESSNNTMARVHDFLGVEASASASAIGNLHESQQHQHQHQRLSVMNHFQHHLPHRDSPFG